MSETNAFYRNLPALQSFSDAMQTTRHSDVPKDWWIIIADVIGSTKAIESGAYKNVNTVGVACIAAVMNVDRNIDIPFVFGGDGATFAIPDALSEPVIPALREAQRLARESFDLMLRVGMVKVSALANQGYWVRLAKVRLSKHMTQSTFSGRGWEEAERLVKDQHAPGVLRVNESDGITAGSFDGFECRWQGVPSFQDHKLALLIAAISQDPGVNLATYQSVTYQIQTIYGDVSSYHPLRPKHMQLTLNPKLLSHEWRVRSSQLPLWQRLGYLVRMVLQNIAGRILFARNMNTAAVQWSHYKDELVENSDFRKFDGMLRMVVDGSETQFEALQGYLDHQFQQGHLVYGMHKSREALVTCIVQSYNGNHMHFVDGSDGGYALAARGLKQQLKQLKH